MIYYCTENLRKLRKCCPRGENLNLNGESCTDHLAEEDELGQTFIKTAMVIILVQQVDICNLNNYLQLQVCLFLRACLGPFVTL